MVGEQLRQGGRGVSGLITPIKVGASTYARVLGGVSPWMASFDGEQLRIDDGTVLPVAQIRDVEMQRRLMWSDLTISDMSGRATVMAGVETRSAQRLGGHLRDAILESRRRAGLWDELVEHGPGIVDWWARVVSTMDSPTWLTRRQLDRLEHDRPQTPSGRDLVDVWSIPDLAARTAALPVGWVEAVAGWAQADLRTWALERNAGLLWNEKQLMRDWFETIEKSPLTDEQIDAVVRFDTRTLVVAAAGSGKTSTMVAKAAYAIARQIVRPDEILMLAFNDQAAKELGDRVRSRLTGPAPKTSTFHAFGLWVIGQALGCKPDVVDLRDDGLGRLSRLIDELRDEDPGFRRDWDVFRLVFGRPLDEGDGPHDDLDGAPSGAFETLNGELVRSQGEQLIANWLWLNGVAYEYERPYEHDVADAGHSQYRPDFFYPDLAVYHEHWATGPDGRPPASFVGYEQSMRWRRDTHSQHGTTLIETSWGDLVDGSLLDRLRDELTRLGATLVEDPYRPIAGRPPIEDEELLQLARNFMVHAKSNRIDLTPPSRAGLRERLFLRLASRIMTAWDAGLRRDGLVDFEDMLNQATDLIQAGAWCSPYRLIMVDEMQDTSLARARLIKALIDQQADTFLFAVGDDWQSINRFAGSDLSVMSHFTDWFGPADTCYLTRTFRSPQSLCDATSAFVIKNPAQIRKRVISDRPGPQPPVAVATVPGPRYGRLVAEHLEGLDAAANAPKSVLLLGRYNADEAEVAGLDRRPWAHLSVRFRTVHKAKGAEADHVVVVNVCHGAFPSTVRDDPLLSFAMPSAESFPDAEERRLFYVALTRARESVLLVTREKRESGFITELARDGWVTLSRPGVSEPAGERCPECRVGTVVRKHRRADGHPFLACSRYPQCHWTQRRSSSPTQRAVSK
jgi:DNA helicase-4